MSRPRLSDGGQGGGMWAQSLRLTLRPPSSPCPFGEETIAVDTHIFRVGNRTGLAVGKTPYEVEVKRNAIVPAIYRRHAHHWLILHGRYVCVARRPLCEKCIIADLCKWPGKVTTSP